jgi:hypothetical protein
MRHIVELQIAHLHAIPIAEDFEGNLGQQEPAPGACGGSAISDGAGAL